jgi:hypothetical protein
MTRGLTLVLIILKVVGESWCWSGGRCIVCAGNGEANLKNNPRRGRHEESLDVEARLSHFQSPMLLQNDMMSKV